MKSIFNQEYDSKSNSTIQLEFSESMLQILENNRNSSTKRSLPKDKQTNFNKKQRLNCFQNQPIISLSESDESQEQQNEILCKRSISIENHLDWFKDFFRQSLDTIRDTVLEACITAISSQSIIPLNANNIQRNLNVNNHLTYRSQSQQSLTSHKTPENLSNYRLKNSSSIIQEKNNILLMHHDDEHIEKKQRIHYRSRLSSYPMHKNVLRTPVSDIRVPWSYPWTEYKPIRFTAEEIYLNPGADPDLLKSSSSISLHFNAIDGGIDRRSVYHPYQIREYDGLPLNPIGRTGLEGRGVLLRWGPNIYHYIIICRWKRNIHGEILVHPSNGKKLLEILLEIQTDGYKTNDLILTGGLYMLGSRFPPQLQDRLKRFIIHTDILLNNKKDISSLSLNNLFEQKPTPWKGAYFDDARNTDNAWIELSIEYLLDNDHQLTSCIPILSNQQLNQLEQPRFVWKDLQHRIDIGPRTHYRLIKNLASKLNAYF